jgi:hypothetical protein
MVGRLQAVSRKNVYGERFWVNIYIYIYITRKYINTIKSREHVNIRSIPPSVSVRPHLSLEFYVSLTVHLDIYV